MHFTPSFDTTLPETNIAPARKPGPQKETIIFQPSIFRCKLAVSFREASWVFHLNWAMKKTLIMNAV